MDKRCFLAIKIPHIAQFRRRLESLSHDIDVKLKLVDPDKYHFTLHFFGDITDLEIDKIKIALEDIEVPNFSLNLDGTGVIPNKNFRKARVFYVNPNQGSDHLRSIKHEVDSRLSLAGFNVKKRSFLPHLTVARIRGGRDVEKLANLWLQQKDLTSEPFEIKQMHLIHSNLTHQGPIYNDLVTFP